MKTSVGTAIVYSIHNLLQPPVVKLAIMVLVRPYKPKDWQDICSIHDRARVVELEAFMNDKDITPMAKAVEDETDFFSMDTFVAVSKKDAALGFIAIREEELAWLYIDPDYHRRGLGKRLVEHVKPLLGPNGFVLCLKENHQAVLFYQALGFNIIAFFPGNVRGHPCTCVRMAFPGSIHQYREPKPTLSSLRAHGYSKENWGKPKKDKNGIWHWGPE